MKNELVITPVHGEGPYYRTKFPPHFVFHVLADEGETVKAWYYNAWGMVGYDRYRKADIEEVKK